MLHATVIVQGLRTEKISGAAQPACRPAMHAAEHCKPQQRIIGLVLKVLVGFDLCTSEEILPLGRCCTVGGDRHNAATKIRASFQQVFGGLEDVGQCGTATNREATPIELR